MLPMPREKTKRYWLEVKAVPNKTGRVASSWFKGTKKDLKSQLRQLALEHS